MGQKLFKNFTHIALSNPHNCKINAVLAPDVLTQKTEGLSNALTLLYLRKARGGMQTQAGHQGPWSNPQIPTQTNIRTRSFIKKRKKVKTISGPPY